MTLSECFAINGLDYLLDGEKEQKFIKLAQLLKIKNEVVNLTAVKDDEGIYAKHFADSAFIVPEIKENAKMIDVGCGGGFPSLPVAILRSDLSVISLDSTSKKLAFVSDAAAELDLRNLKTVCGRAEEVCAGNMRESIDFCTARAVAALDILAELCIPFLSVGGVFAAMKTDDSELKSAEKAAKTLGAEIKDVKKYKLICADGTADRCIISFQKIKNTPQAYPRRYSQIKAKPL